MYNLKPFKRMFASQKVGRADFDSACTQRHRHKRQNLETWRLGGEKNHASHAGRIAGKAGQDEALLDVVSASLQPLIAQSCLCLFLAELANRLGAYCTDSSKHAPQSVHVCAKHVQLSCVTHF